MQSKTKELIKADFNIKEETLKLLETVEKNITPQFEQINEIAEYNQLKVLKAFQPNKISYAHFGETTGYGYDDMGRDALDKVYADIFGSEAAIVRHNIISGTQAIASCLYAVLRPGDTLLSAVGKPYDTMEEVIGIRGDSDVGSLKDFGVKYEQT
ncbi:MAG: methionine gamma-lyase family protein, partial [Oscillospiraceae bacterium]